MDLKYLVVLNKNKSSHCYQEEILKCIYETLAFGGEQMNKSFCNNGIITCRHRNHFNKGETSILNS